MVSPARRRTVRGAQIAWFKEVAAATYVCIESQARLAAEGAIAVARTRRLEQTAAGPKRPAPLLPAPSARHVQPFAVPSTETTLRRPSRGPVLTRLLRSLFICRRVRMTATDRR